MESPVREKRWTKTLAGCSGYVARFRNPLDVLLGNSFVPHKKTRVSEWERGPRFAIWMICLCRDEQAFALGDFVGHGFDLSRFLNLRGEEGLARFRMDPNRSCDGIGVGADE